MYRYFDPRNQQVIFDSNLAKKWEPIDFYNGADHATAHLLYARFIARFFTKIGLINDPEPFKQFLFNGKITASDGKMFSKSKGNGVDPLEIINEGYGADALRTYLMFAAPLDLWVKWDPQGVPGAYRFLNRVWNLTQEYLESGEGSLSDDVKIQINKSIHSMIKKVTEDIEANRYNTAIAAAMTATNDLYKIKIKHLNKDPLWQEALESLVACIAPFAPHMSDELWQQIGHSSTVNKDSWPKYDEKYLVSDSMEIVVQVNGKVRAKLELSTEINEEQVFKAVMENSRIKEILSSVELIKKIYIPGKLVSLVVK